MARSTKTRAALSAAAFCMLSGALSACADGAPSNAAGHPSAERPTLRVLVQLVRPADDGAAISSEAARIAGVPVAYAAAAGPAWHALSLSCAVGAECDAALARLRAASTTYRAVEIDGRKTRTAS